jgi:hypothetical protein
MPAPELIHQVLTSLANEWRLLAFGWHVTLGLGALAVAAGWRPSQRVAAVLIATPVASVAVLAWSVGNPFNGILFGALALTMGVLARSLGPQPVSFSTPPWEAVGALLVVFGCVYPHFLKASTWLEYLVQAPLGLVPCPTLSLAAGLTLIFGSFGSKKWALILASVGLIYGLIGALVLGVGMDAVLVAGAMMLAASTVPLRAFGAGRGAAGNHSASASNSVRFRSSR